MEKFGIGQPLRRLEDPRLLTGAGRFVDDIALDGLVHGCVLRSPHAHARLVGIDVAAARAAPGVLAVLTGADCVADGLGGVPTRTPAKNSDGTAFPKPLRPVLATERVRFVGEGVAFVVAGTRDQALAAAELVEVDYEPLPAVTSARAALAGDAPLVWGEAPGNVCVTFETGDAAATDAAFASAAHVTRIEVDNQRVTAVPIEPRGAVGTFDPGTGEYTIVFASQNVHANRRQLAEDVLRIPAGKLRAVAHDVGGGFGAKNSIYPEHALVLWAARRTGRPVKWVNDRSESFLSDAHGRDQRSTVELALDAAHRFTALRVRSIGAFGPYLLSTGPFTQTAGTARTQGGPYRVPVLHFHSRAVFTHTAPTDPYRGAGRPEASYQMERVIDAAARELGLDRVALRRANLLTPSELPHTTGTGMTIECGNFPEVLDRTLELADWTGFASRAEASRARGVRRGIGVCCYLECSGGPPREHAAIAFLPGRRLRLAVGSQSTGTGHETVLPQVVAARLGIPVEAIDYVQADTDATPIGGGHGGSRVLEMGGSAAVGAADAVIEKGRALAADLLEADAGDVEFTDGAYRIVGTDRRIGLFEVAEAARDPARSSSAEAGPGLDARHEHDREAITFPNGCHVAEVEVDPDTGRVRLVDYAVVDDFGTIVNPLTAEGQAQGGTAQGVGQALLERIVYEPEGGQLLTGSLMDYCLPRADDLPAFRMAFYEDAPSRTNVLGVKGAGEAGCCGSLGAIVNAVLDALAADGVRHLDMPLTSERVWTAMSAGSRVRFSRVVEQKISSANSVQTG